MMNSVFLYTSFCFVHWSRINHRGTRASLERALLGTIIMSAIIWVSSLVMIYTMFVQYGKSQIKMPWVMEKTTFGTYINSTAPDKAVIETTNQMHYWTQNLQKALICTLGAMGMTF